MAIRKGAIVKYIGDNPLMVGQTYRVQQKCGHLITIYAPCRYLGGEVHLQKCAMQISDFEEVNKK